MCDAPSLGGRACEACALKLERKADVDYSGLLPSLFSLNVGSYYMHSEQPTIAVFRPLAMIFPRPEKPPLQRFVHASKEPSLQWNSLDKIVA
jgi:hypothetical protein